MKNKIPYISICIPAYKNATFLKRLLDSIVIQSFRDFEVIITDDSPDDELSELVESYLESIPAILYQRNKVALGSPGNWNKAISLGSGKWIKIMHDDDWFAGSDSLEQYYQATINSSCSFIFSGFTNIDIQSGKKDQFVISILDQKMLKINSLYLFRTNYIGHPSTTLIRNELNEWFDEKIKWVVDFEFYIRLLQKEEDFYVIKLPLIKIGVSDAQITKSSFRQKEVEIPENIYLLHKLGVSAMKNYFVFDYYWRMLRNLKIGSRDDLTEFQKGINIPDVLFQMINFQNKIGPKLLRMSGVYSKICMSIHFLVFRLFNLKSK